MDGRQVLEKLKSRPATAGIDRHHEWPAKPTSATAVDAGPDRRLSGKTFFLKDATTKSNAVVDRIALEKLSKAASYRRSCCAAACRR